MYLSVRRHGNVNSSFIEFTLHSLDYDRCFHQPIIKYRGFTTKFLGQVLTFAEHVKTSYKNCLEFVILCRQYRRWHQNEAKERIFAVSSIWRFDLDIHATTTPQSNMSWNRLPKRFGIRTLTNLLSCKHQSPIRCHSHHDIRGRLHGQRTFYAHAEPWNIALHPWYQTLQSRDWKPSRRIWWMASFDTCTSRREVGPNPPSRELLVSRCFWSSPDAPYCSCFLVLKKKVRSRSSAITRTLLTWYLRSNIGRRSCRCDGAVSARSHKKDRRSIFSQYKSSKSISKGFIAGLCECSEEYTRT